MRGLGRGIAAVALALVAGSLALTREAARVTPAPLVAGCFTDGCFFEFRDKLEPIGHMIDENTWESSSVDGTDWLPYEGRVRYSFHPAFGGRLPYHAAVYLSTNPSPKATNSLISQASGNVAILEFDNNYVTVYNDTCANYYMRVVVFVPPFPDPPPVDAGDAGTEDAGTDDAGTEDAGTEDAATDAN